jgi:hypothetical protein
MDADGTPSGRGRSTEPGSGRPVPDGGQRAREAGADRSQNGATVPAWSDTGDVVTGVLDPDLRAPREVGPWAIPEASDLFDELVTRRRSPIIPTPRRTDRSPTRGVARRGGRHRLRWAYAAIVVVVAVAVAVGLSSRAQLQRTDTELTATRGRLHLAVDRARAAEVRLSAVTAEASSAASLLTAETAQLASVQAQLASTEANVFANGVSINDLDTCLSGVERALNQISLDDQVDAAATLNSVAGSCRAAAPSP